jgi:glycosyltransferase involved in cell wall biosynthesis
MRRVLHVIETMAPHEGGPPRVAAGLASAQRAIGIDAHILCGDGRALPEHLQYWLAQTHGLRADTVHAPLGRTDSLPARAAAVRRWLGRHLHDVDIVHIHQLWRLVPTLAAQRCRHTGTPYLIAPHTSLSPWALAQKRLKKSLARVLVWNRNFSGATGFHALNELEAQEIRACLGGTAPPVFIVPNGVSLQEFAAGPGAAAPSADAPGLAGVAAGSPFILFLARLHTMKGPDLLLEAFGKLAPEVPQLQLVFAGPDYGMLATLQRRAAALNLAGRVHFHGLVSGTERLWLLHNALCLCQPSRDEGFSLSILEAMACSRPVVISDRCKFPDVARRGAGLIVPTSVPELTAALRIYATNASRRTADGGVARLLIEQYYTWESIARRTEQMYAEALGDGAKAHGPRTEHSDATSR